MGRRKNCSTCRRLTSRSVAAAFLRRWQVATAGGDICICTLLWDQIIDNEPHTGLLDQRAVECKATPAGCCVWRVSPPFSQLPPIFCKSRRTVLRHGLPRRLLRVTRLQDSALGGQSGGRRDERGRSPARARGRARRATGRRRSRGRAASGRLEGQTRGQVASAQQEPQPRAQVEQEGSQQEPGAAQAVSRKSMLAVWRAWASGRDLSTCKLLKMQL